MFFDSQFLGLLNNPSYQIGLGLLFAWVVVWKGVALWRAARNGQRYWFLAILIINTFSILEIIYVFWFSKAKTQEQAPK